MHGKSPRSRARMRAATSSNAADSSWKRATIAPICAISWSRDPADAGAGTGRHRASPAPPQRCDGSDPAKRRKPRKRRAAAARGTSARLGANARRIHVRDHVSGDVVVVRHQSWYRIRCRLYEHRIVVSRWISSGSPARIGMPTPHGRIDTGRRFWAFVTTLPLTLLTLANLIIRIAILRGRSSLVAGGGAGGVHRSGAHVFLLHPIDGRPDAGAGLTGRGGSRRPVVTPQLPASWIVLAAWLAALRTFSCSISRAPSCARSTLSERQQVRVDLILVAVEHMPCGRPG